MSTKPKRRALSKTDQRELARQLTVILERVYDGTFDASGAVGSGIVRRMEGANAMLGATLELDPRRKKILR